jgi:hypothetical protein
VKLEVAGPVLCVDAAEGQAHAQAEVGRPARQRREGALVRWGFEVRAAEFFGVQLLHGGCHAGHLTEVLEAPLALGAFAEGPHVGQFLAGDSATTVGYPDDDVLLCLANGDLNGWRHRGGRDGAVLQLLLVPLDDGLDRVAQELADDVLEVAEDVGEAGGEVAVDLDIRDLDAGSVGGAGQGADGGGAALDDVLCYALDEDLADEVGLGELGAGGKVGRVEGFCEGEVLLGDDAAGYPLTKKTA